MTFSCTPGTASNGGLLLTGTLTSTWGNLRMQLASDAQRLPGLAHHAQQRERGQDPVAGGRVVEKQQVAGLLAAQFAPRRRISSYT